MNNLFRGNSFKIVARNDISEFIWNATNISMPSINIGKVEPRMRGIILNRSGDITYGEMTIQIALSDTLSEYYQLFQYMMKMKNEGFIHSNYPFKMDIVINDNKNNKILTVFLGNAIINNLGSFDLVTIDDEIVTMPISISFSDIDMKKPE